MRPFRSILILDDDLHFLDLLDRSISDEPTLRVVHQSTNVDEAKAWLRTHTVDIVITDLIMPGKSGYLMIEETRKLQPNSTVVAVTSYPTLDSAVQCFRLGANAFFDKAEDINQVVASIASSSPSVVTMHSSVAAEMVSAIPITMVSANSSGIDQNFSPRMLKSASTDTKILSLVCDGKSNREIAHSLGLSESTVKRRVSDLLSQNRYTSRTEMAVKTLRQLLSRD